MSLGRYQTEKGDAFLYRRLVYSFHKDPSLYQRESDDLVGRRHSNRQNRAISRRGLLLMLRSFRGGPLGVR